MRQSASNESSLQSPDSSALKPPLSSALSCLNVYLEEELARYRRQRQGRPIAPSKSSKTIKPKQKPLDLISVKSVKADTSNSPRPQPTASSKRPPGAVAIPPPPPNPFLYPAAAASSDAALLSDVSNQTVEPAGPLALASKSAEKSNDQGADVAYAMATRPSGSGSPDGYLESSEELIKSLADQLIPEPETAQTSQHGSPWTSKLATPVNVGSFLLLLVASVGVGFVVTKPDTVNHLFQGIRSDSPRPNQAVESANSASDLNRGGAFRPLGPDLSSQEFIDLNLDTLSTLPGNNAPLGPQLTAPTNALSEAAPASNTLAQSNTATTDSSLANQNSANPAPSPQTSVTSIPQSYSAPTAIVPSPVVSATPTASPEPALSAPPSVAPSPNPASSSSGSSAAANTTPLPSLATAPPAVVTAPIPSASAAATTRTDSASGLVSTAPPRYRVVTPYTGDPSLDQVRGVVADAFVRESQIQAGAFEDESAAQARVRELQAQGIPARVYSD